MDVGAALSDARRRAGLSQRELAARTGVAQPTLARIELGLVDPRVGTLTRLLVECDGELHVTIRPGAGVDRTQIRELLRLSPLRRLDLLRRDVENLAALEAARG